MNVYEVRLGPTTFDAHRRPDAAVRRPDEVHRAVRAVALMGCQVVLTGASADVAWALTQAGGIQAAMQTRRNLQDGLAYAYDKLALN